MILLNFVLNFGIWVKLADTAERSLHWLIPAATLAYFVFRILPSLGF